MASSGSATISLPRQRQRDGSPPDLRLPLWRGSLPRALVSSLRLDAKRTPKSSEKASQGWLQIDFACALQDEEVPETSRRETTLCMLKLVFLPASFPPLVRHDDRCLPRSHLVNFVLHHFHIGDMCLLPGFVCICRLRPLDC